MNDPMRAMSKADLDAMMTAQEPLLRNMTTAELRAMTGDRDRNAHRPAKETPR